MSYLVKVNELPKEGSIILSVGMLDFILFWICLGYTKLTKKYVILTIFSDNVLVEGKITYQLEKLLSFSNNSLPYLYIVKWLWI